MESTISYGYPYASVRIQTGTNCSENKSTPVHICRTGAVGLQALRNDPQEDAQHHVEHCPVTLHEIAQSLRHREHPLAHRQTGEDVVAEVRAVSTMRRVLHEGHTPRPLQE
jgi:hypothetical protein